MKIGRNDKCPCGSGKKYKKCCIDKKSFEEELIEKLKSVNPFEYHNNYIHTKKVKAPEINKILLNVYDNHDKMNKKDVVDDYLKVMNYLLEYAKKQNCKNTQDLDECELVADFVGNVIGDFEDVILNLNKEDYDLNIVIDYLDRIIDTLELDDNMYLNTIRQKTELLFKLGRVEEGESLMLKYLEKHPKSTFAYVELVDDFERIGNLEKSRYYYDLGLSQGKMEDIDALEERIYYFEKNKC